MSGLAALSMFPGMTTAFVGADPDVRGHPVGEHRRHVTSDDRNVAVVEFPDVRTVVGGATVS